MSSLEVRCASLAASPSAASLCCLRSCLRSGRFSRASPDGLPILPLKPLHKPHMHTFIPGTGCYASLVPWPHPVANAAAARSPPHMVLVVTIVPRSGRDLVATRFRAQNSDRLAGASTWLHCPPPRQDLAQRPSPALDQLPIAMPPRNKSKAGAAPRAGLHR